MSIEVSINYGRDYNGYDYTVFSEGNFRISKIKGICSEEVSKIIGDRQELTNKISEFSNFVRQYNDALVRRKIELSCKYKLFRVFNYLVERCCNEEWKKKIFSIDSQFRRIYAHLEAHKEIEARLKKLYL